jgi:MFS family permease
MAPRARSCLREKMLSKNLHSAMLESLRKLVCLKPDLSHERIHRHRVSKLAFAPGLSNGVSPVLLIGVIVAASTITGVFFKLPSGALSDVLGRKRVMVLGALFFAAPPFLYPFLREPWSLLGLRFVHGFATAIFSPVASAYAASLAETGRGARLGWFSSANDFGATGGRS